MNHLYQQLTLIILHTIFTIVKGKMQILSKKITKGGADVHVPHNDRKTDISIRYRELSFSLIKGTIRGYSLPLIAFLFN